MSDGEDLLQEQVVKDNEHFKALLNLVPASAYFSAEDKDELWGNDPYSDDETGKKKKHKQKGILNPMTTLSITQLTELKQKGKTLSTQQNSKKRTKAKDSTQDDDNETDDTNNNGIDAKHQGKKQSRSLKKKKLKAKEIKRRDARLEELKERLRAKVEQIKARKMSGNRMTSQEEKKLKRQEKKMKSRLKNKNNLHKEDRHKAKVAEGLRSPPQNQILNHNGVPVRSKFDFSIMSTGKDSTKSSDLQGKDYKRLLEKVEKRKEKVAALKEKDLEAGQKLEEKLTWQSVMGRARGEKIKDDADMLKKSLKKKESVKKVKHKKWEDRKNTVEDKISKKQEKRQANIDKRKSDKKDSKRKLMIKKGRIIPGF